MVTAEYCPELGTRWLTRKHGANATAQFPQARSIGLADQSEIGLIPDVRWRLSVHEVIEATVVRATQLTIVGVEAHSMKEYH